MSPEDMASMTTTAWPRHYRCYVCDPVSVRATIRVFSGVYADGWPACDDHRGHAFVDALRALSKPDVDPDYTVRAYRVLVDEVDDSPKLECDPIWVACKPTSRLEKAV
jgi:hypothetical protein